MGSKEREVIVNSFMLCHFNYCPLIWSFCSNVSQKKLEKINERALRLALSNYTPSYDTLLVKAKPTTIHIRSIRLLALEMFKTSKTWIKPLWKTILRQNPLVIIFDNTMFFVSQK